MRIAKLLQRYAVGAQAVSHYGACRAVGLQRFPEEFQRRRPVAFQRQEGFQNFALVVGGSPEVAAFAVHTDDDLVQMPARVSVLAHSLDPARQVLRAEKLPEPVDPETHRLMTHVDATLEGLVLHVAK